MPEEKRPDARRLAALGTAAAAAAARVQVVTGANLAGKTVYLKQLGLIVLLAQIGSFVPADEAELGLCDLIFSRIQSVEGSAVQCSSFGIDLAQVALALRNATEASLVLLDEFGKGTHAADGVALFGATVEHLCRWRAGPKAVLTTHFTEAFRFQLVSPEEEGLQLCCMRVLPPEEEGGGVAYLYQLAPGAAEQSFGIECARRAGLDEATLARAEEILGALERGEAVPPPAEGLCAEAAARADAREARRERLCRLVADRLRALDPEDADATRALLDFVRS
uniref:MutS-like protein 5 n=1 Tax=Lingulaulax polyedra TaxID=160621 RepID=A0A516AGG7_LINPO|nr:MutS-like protein 5 [Lingulodinium polyedra]